jgi:hypothetical protein
MLESVLKSEGLGEVFLNYDNKQLTVYDISLLKQISIFKE